jgi:hypothetical protein
MMWACPLPRHNRHKQFVFENKYYGKSPRKRKYFFFSVLRAIARLALNAPMSRSQLHSVKYVYAVDYKSMIGGYRPLLVMNSLNPLLIPL